MIRDSGDDDGARKHVARKERARGERKRIHNEIRHYSHTESQAERMNVTERTRTTEAVTFVAFI
jgi:hypothetical protein